MLYYQLLKQKYKYQTLDQKEVDRINDILSKSKITFYINNNKKVNLKSKKNNFNIILNKLTESNYQEILENEIKRNNINIKNIFNFIYLLMDKIENEGKFSECYSNVIIDIDRILTKNENDIEFSIQKIIAERFYEILEEDDEYKKDNYLKFLFLMIEKGYFFKNLINKIMDDITEKKDYYMIYLWLNINKSLKKKYIKQINECIDELKKSNNIRLTTLFESLLTKKEKSVKTEKKINKVESKDTIICQNIIKEYMLIEDINEVKFFIKDSSITNKLDLLEDALINELFINEDEDFLKLVNLIELEILNLSKIKQKIKKIKNDDIFIDFNERIKYINNIK